MTEGQTLAKANLEEMAFLIRMKADMHLPFLFRFAGSVEIKQLDSIRKSFGENNKALLKTLRELKEFKDFDNEYIHTVKLRHMFRALKERTPEVLQVVRKYVDELHQLKEIIPDFVESDGPEIYNCINKLKRYNKENFLEVFPYLQADKVRRAVLDNKKIELVRLEVEKFKRTILKRKQALMFKKSYGIGYKEFLKHNRRTNEQNFTYISQMDLFPLKFIKDRVLADFWGRETLCCLKNGGAAEKLLTIIENSPLAGELVGEINHKKVSSYVWDFVEIVDGVARKTLIMDNIEANNKLSEKEVEDIWDKIFSYGKYKALYLGTCRNDCEVNNKYKDTIRERQSTIPGFDELIKRHVYTHADSDQMYLIREREDSTNINWRRMDISDLHSVKYIERYIYGDDLYLEDDKTDILKQVTLETPCYIIDNETNIYGYMLTKWKYLDNDNKESFDNAGTRKFYIEDLVVSKSNRKAKLKLKEIFDDLIGYLKKENIKEVCLNANQFSENFIKRLFENDIDVIEENKAEILPVNFLK